MSSPLLQDLRYFFRRFKVDFITVGSALILYWIAAVLVDNPRVLLGLSIGITLLSGIVIIASEIQDRDFVWLSMRRRDHAEAWIGAGGLSYVRTEHAHRITGSHDGVILADTLAWSDYRLKFTFRLDHSSLGVTLRAANLGNLVMLQILQDRIKAHIRINGTWMIWDHLPELGFLEQLVTGVWYCADITCDKRNVRVDIWRNRSAKQTTTWQIPAGDVGLGVSGPTISGPLFLPFAVNYDYGAIGFRNDGGESALVRDLLVEKL